MAFSLQNFALIGQLPRHKSAFLNLLRCYLLLLRQLVIMMTTIQYPFAIYYYSFYDSWAWVNSYLLYYQIKNYGTSSFLSWNFSYLIIERILRVNSKGEFDYDNLYGRRFEILVHTVADR